MSDDHPVPTPAVPCCPELSPDTHCDVIDFRYRLPHRASVDQDGRSVQVPVAVTLHVRIERCPGPLALGELAYSTTLLPGEKVRLFTADRRTRFSFDSETNLSYRHEQTSEEQYYMSSMADFMSDLTVVNQGSTTNTSRGSTRGHAETSGALESLFLGPSVDISGSYDASSTSAFLNSLQQHARSSDRRSVQATRTANSVSVGEVTSRSHAEGESEDQFESSSREFANPNRCHAVTFFFHRINKTQIVRGVLESIERQVDDRAAPTKIANNDFLAAGSVSAIPTSVLATSKTRLEAEEVGRRSDALARQAAGRGIGVGVGGPLLGQVGVAPFPLPVLEPLPAAVRTAALQEVDRQLVEEGLLDAKTGEVSKDAQQRFSFEQRSSLPTAGLLVKGCLDDCDICEVTLVRGIELDLTRKELENRLLERQIELLEKSQEYRCCPEGEPDEDG
jgi:hypothetical protein